MSNFAVQSNTSPTVSLTKGKQLIERTYKKIFTPTYHLS